MDSLDRNSLREYISEVSGVDLNSITNVEVKGSFSFVEVKSEVAEIITGTFKNQRYNNRSVRIESRGNKETGEGRTRDRGRGSYGGGERRSFGGNRGGYGGGDRRGSYGEKKSYGNSDRADRGERRDREYGDKKKSYSGEKSFSKGSASGGGDRKSNFSREKRPRKQF